MNRIVFTPGNYLKSSAGRPIANGYIYIGEPDKSPQAFPVQVSALQEDTTTVQIPQPIRTSLGGQPIYNGSVVTLLVDGDYSMQVLNSDLTQEYYIPSYVNSDVSDLAKANTLADLKAIVSPQSNDTVTTVGRTTSGDGGGGVFYFDTSDLSTEVTADTLSGIYAAPDSDPTGASGAWIRQYDGVVNVAWFGAIGDSSADDTAAIQAALDIFTSPLGGIVMINPGLRYKVTTLNVATNVELRSPQPPPDQDETKTFGYDAFWGGVIYVSGTINLTHGSSIRNCAVLEAGLNGYGVPTTDGEANALVAAFTGTALTLNGTGDTIEDLIILGFTNAIADNGNRHEISRVRFDCTAGIELTSGAGISRLITCHSWPYLTAELGLSSSVNYRSGTAFKFTGNSDRWDMDKCYTFGHETGFHLTGTAGNVNLYSRIMACSADSGNIGASGTSVGYLLDGYTGFPRMLECQSTNYDIPIHVNLEGTNGTQRFARVDIIGGIFTHASDVYVRIDKGTVDFIGVQLSEDGGLGSTSCIEWNADDGGSITGCTFSDMYQSSGEGLLITYATTAIDNSIKCKSNNQINVHIDNQFSDEKSTKLTLAKTPDTGVQITGGVVTVTGSNVLLIGEGAAVDDLDTISGGYDGQIVVLRSFTSAYTVTAKDGTGNLLLAGDFAMADAADRLMLIFDSSLGGGSWCEISRSTNV